MREWCLVFGGIWFLVVFGIWFEVWFEVWKEGDPLHTAARLAMRASTITSSFSILKNLNLAKGIAIALEWQNTSLHLRCVLQDAIFTSCPDCVGDSSH